MQDSYLFGINHTQIIFITIHFMQGIIIMKERGN